MTRHTVALVGLAIGLGALSVGNASADPPPAFEFIHADLTRSTGELIDLNDDGVIFADERGDLVQISSDDLLGMEAVDADWNAGTTGMWANRVRVRPGLVRLIDGQRLTGTPSMIRQDNEVMSWDHPLLGLVEVPLERIDRVQQNRSIIGAREPEIMQPATSSDVLLLVNGDRLEGFVASLGAQIGFEVDGKMLLIPIGDVDQVALANPAEPLQGQAIWLADGSVLSVPGFQVTGGLAEIVQRTEPATEAGAAGTESTASLLLQSDSLRAFVDEAEELVPLASLTQPDDIERLPTAAAFSAHPLLFPRPMTAEYPLPDGATWLAFEAELPLRARTWGHADLRIIADGRVLETLVLTPESPTVQARVPLADASRLELVLSPAGFGSVQVTAIVRDALIAIDR